MKKRILIAAFLFFAASFVFAEAKNALLIANSAYQHMGTLSTPLQEARGLKRSLEKLGFSVKIVENGGREKMLDALDDFSRLLKKSGGIGFFHYGGHAVQVGGKNYLIPVDADIEEERRCSTRAVDVDDVMLSMAAETNIVVLDSCRDNPLPASSRSVARGLSVAHIKPQNSIIVYSADAGKTAKDGLFTPILSEKILQKKSLVSILTEVRREVNKASGGLQLPKNDDGLLYDVYLAGYESAPTASANTVAVPESEPAVVAEPAPAQPSVKKANYDLQAAINLGDFGPLMESILQRAQEKAGTNFKKYSGESQRGWRAGFNAALELESGYVLGFRDFQSGYFRWKLICVTAGKRFAKNKDYEAKLKVVSKKYGWKLPSDTNVDEDRQKKFASSTAFYDWVSDSEKASDELAEFLKCFK